MLSGQAGWEAGIAFIGLVDVGNVDVFVLVGNGVWVLVALGNGGYDLVECLAMPAFFLLFHEGFGKVGSACGDAECVGAALEGKFGEQVFAFVDYACLLVADGKGDFVAYVGYGNRAIVVVEFDGQFVCFKAAFVG